MLAVAHSAYGQERSFVALRKHIELLARGLVTIVV
jgi:hypothetical protein